MTDYFTRAEFRTFARDPGGASPTYSDAEINAAQAEVIEHLESWAGSAWPNVTGVAGDGTAAARRSTTETFDGDNDVFFLGSWPVESIVDITVDGAVVASDSYYLYSNEGFVLAATGALGTLPRGVIVEYRFGYASTPQAIKGPAMQATKSLLDARRGRARGIPGNVTQHTTEGTTIVFDTDEDKNKNPWVWDEDASRDVRSYVERDRAPKVAAV